MLIRVEAAAFMAIGRDLMGLRRRRRRDVELRRFKAHFGTTDERCVVIWNILRADPASQPLNGAKPEHLLWALLMLKTYDTEPVLSGKAHCDEKTFRKWSWKFIVALSNILYKVVVFNRRWIGAQGHNHTMSVDGTDCRINEPKPFSRQWYSHKFRAAGVRYEVAVSIRRSEIVWINGPFPCGRYPDITIFRVGLRNRLRHGERVMADKGYRGERGCVDTPNDNDPPGVRALKKRVASRHETVNCRLKSFGCLSGKFRHDLSKHRVFFQAVTVITQVNITNGDPLFDV